jgi:hypothetical protein
VAKLESPKIEAAIACAAAFASTIGWYPALYAGLRYIISAAGEARFPHRHFLVAFGLACVGALSGILVVFVREFQPVMRQLQVTKGELARGVILGGLVAAAAVLSAWAAVGFQGWFMFVPIAAVALGAVLSARHVHPFGRRRVATAAGGRVTPA